MSCMSWFGSRGAKSRVRPTGNNDNLIVNVADGGRINKNASSNRPASSLPPLQLAAILQQGTGSTNPAGPTSVVQPAKRLSSPRGSSGANGACRSSYVGNNHLAYSSMNDSTNLNNLFTSNKPSPPQLTFEQASLVIDMVPVPMCIIDNTGNIRSFNMAFRSAVWFDVGKKRSTLNMLDIIGMEDADKFYTAVRKLNTETLDHNLKDCSEDYVTKLRVNGTCRRVKYNWTLGSEGDQKLIIVTGRFETSALCYIDDLFCCTGVRKARIKPLIIRKDRGMTSLIPILSFANLYVQCVLKQARRGRGLRANHGSPCTVFFQL